MEFTYFTKLLKRKWYLLTATSVMAAALTFGLLSLKPRQYYCKSQISAGITDNNRVSFEKSELSWNEINNKFTNFLEFLNSNEIYYMLGYRLMLLDIESKGAYKTDEYILLRKKYDEETLERLASLMREHYKALKMPDLRIKEDAEVQEVLKAMYIDPENMKSILSISRIPGSDYIKVEVKTKNPDLSCQLVNSYCEEAIRLHNENEIKNAEKSVAFFKTLLTTKKAAFEKKLDSLARAKAGSQVVNFGSESEAQIGRISELENSKNETIQKITGLRRAIANIDQQLGETEKKSKENNLTNHAILNLKNRIEHLNDRYINSGFAHKEMADTLATLKLQLEKKILQLGNELYGDHKASHKELLTKKMDYEVELAMAEAGLNTLEATIVDNRGNLTKFVGNEAALTPLEMAVNVSKDEYTRIVDKYNDAINTAMKNGALVRQIEIGQPAGEPEPAHRVMYSGIAALASLLLGMSVLFMVVYFDNSIKNPENFIRKTGLPLLGFVYNVPANSENVDKMFFDTQEHVNKDTKHKEQLRSLRYEIENSQYSVFLFTSPGQGEGKSFVIISLAYSFILNYKKVLIVDTNFKNNTLSVLYNVHRDAENYFYQPQRKLLNESNSVYSIEKKQQGSEPENADKIIRQTRVEGLDILSCTRNDLSPSEIFHGKKFDSLLANLRKKYDYIFMEGPCLNLYSDTKELSTYAEKVIGVFAADKPVSQIDKESIKYLKSIGAKYLGSILNKVEMDDLTI